MTTAAYLAVWVIVTVALVRVMLRPDTPVSWSPGKAFAVGMAVGSLWPVTVPVGLVALVAFWPWLKARSAELHAKREAERDAEVQAERARLDEELRRA